MPRLQLQGQMLDVQVRGYWVKVALGPLERSQAIVLGSEMLGKKTDERHSVKGDEER